MINPIERPMSEPNHILEDKTKNPPPPRVQESVWFRTLSKKISDSVSGIPSINIPGKTALLSLTAGVLIAAAEQAIIAAPINADQAIQQPPASESIIPKQKREKIQTHSPEYVRTEQKEVYALLIQDRETTLPLLEKQELILTESSLSTKTITVYFNELRNDAYTMTVLIRTADAETIELRIYNSDGSKDVMMFRDGEMMSAETKKN